MWRLVSFRDDKRLPEDTDNWRDNNEVEPLPFGQDRVSSPIFFWVALSNSRGQRQQYL